MRFLDTSHIRVRLDERLKAADGTELSVDLYLPPGPGSYPVLLNRTPADNNRGTDSSSSLPPAQRWKAFAAQGYIVAAADVRGRGDSDGTFVPFVNESADGAASIAWLRSLEECDGRVGVFGSGYGAYCAWAAAVADGNVDAIASISPFGAVGQGLLHRGGAVRLDWLFWMHLIGGRTVQAANIPPWSRIHRRLPLHALAEALGRDDTCWQDWLDHLDPNDPFWKALDLWEGVASLSAPALHVTGWWDGYAAGAHYYYSAARRGGKRQQLIIGPWDTAATRRPVARVGDFDFGPRSVLDIDEVLIDFFDGCLRSRGDLSLPSGQAVRVFITGRNEWAALESWPVTSTQSLRLNLSSELGANTRRGDGVLSEVPGTAGGCDTITHNPEVPVEFQPRFVGFGRDAGPLGFTLDQSHITSRDEALVYTSAPLKQELTCVGSPEVTLTVRTTAADADLFVLLSDSFPSGTRDLHLAHAAIRLASLEKFKPGELITVTLHLDAIAHDFQAGHQIRLTVVPSLFPLYARNVQTGEYVTDDEPIIADIEIHHAPDEPALLILPVRQDI